MEVEDLLRKGAYGALMDEEDEGSKFCEEDIDQILQRRTQTITIQSEGKGSTFAKVQCAQGDQSLCKWLWLLTVLSVLVWGVLGTCGIPKMKIPSSWHGLLFSDLLLSQLGKGSVATKAKKTLPTHRLLSGVGSCWTHNTLCTPSQAGAAL